MRRASRGNGGNAAQKSSSSPLHCRCSLWLFLLLVAFLFGLNSISLMATTLSRKHNSSSACPSGDWILCRSSSYPTVSGKRTGSPFAGSDSNADNNNSLATEIIREYVATGNVRAPFSTNSPESSSWSLQFSPGKLGMSSVEAMRQCYADLDVYKNHFRNSRQYLFSISHEHKLMYVLIPKSGSSTSRYMMDKKFGARESYQKNITETMQKNNYTFFTFVRDPLSRFYSQYDESYAQTAPWKTGRKHPFPYLHGEFKSYEDYEDVFCPPHTRKNRRECIYRPTQENGTLTARMERMLREYDGRKPYDIHLHLQVPMMSYYNTGLAFPLQEIYNTTAAKAGWAQLAGPRGVDLEESASTKEKEGVIQGRTYPRRFDKKFVTDATKQRICQLAMLDYCCLNLPLPPPCSHLYCRLSNANTTEKGKHLRIEPWEHPTSLVKP